VKQRIDLAVLLLVLGSSSFAMAQSQPPPNQPSGTSPSAPQEAAPDEGTAPEEGGPSEGAEGPSAAPDVSPGAAAEAAPEAAAEAPIEVAEPEEVAPQTSKSDAEEMVVTGSRIKQASSFNAGAPVQIVDRKQLEYTGVTNMADVVQYLTVAQAYGPVLDTSHSHFRSSLRRRDRNTFTSEEHIPLIRHPERVIRDNERGYWRHHHVKNNV
jgi:hypothetical protein